MGVEPTTTWFPSRDRSRRVAGSPAHR